MPRPHVNGHVTAALEVSVQQQEPLLLPRLASGDLVRRPHVHDVVRSGDAVGLVVVARVEGDVPREEGGWQAALQSEKGVGD